MRVETTQIACTPIPVFHNPHVPLLFTQNRLREVAAAGIQPPHPSERGLQEFRTRWGASEEATAARAPAPAAQRSGAGGKRKR